MDEGDEIPEFQNIDMERWKTVADLFTALAHPVRVAILESLLTEEDRPLTEVADSFDYSRSAVQKHVESLEKAEAVYRPESGDRTYALTPFGMYMAGLAVYDGRFLYEGVMRAAEAEEEAKAEFEGVPLGESALQKAVTERKWEVAGDEVEEVLSDLYPAIELFDADGDQ